MKRIIIFSIAILLSFIANAQMKKFGWQTGLCLWGGEYDSRKYSEKQLKGTSELCHGSLTYLNTRETATTPNEIDSLSLSSLHKEYVTNLKKLKKLCLVKSPYWEEVRQNKINILKRIYELKRITIIAYENPSVLKTYMLADSCFQYVDAIICGGDSLLHVWQRFRKEQCEEHNTDPVWCYDEYYLKKSNTPQKLTWAKLDLMRYGWWKCALYFINRENSDNSWSEFEKLFTNLKHSCEL